MAPESQSSVMPVATTHFSPTARSSYGKRECSDGLVVAAPVPRLRSTPSTEYGVCEDFADGDMGLVDHGGGGDWGGANTPNRLSPAYSSGWMRAPTGARGIRLHANADGSPKLRPDVCDASAAVRLIACFPSQR